MVSVSNIMSEAALRLSEAGIDTANIDARILMEFCLGISREELLQIKNQEILQEGLERYNIFINRRLKREPVSLITGRKEFWGLNFRTTQDTLDPRPDSEALIEAILKHSVRKNIRILDLGTGTGCLLLSLLYELPEAAGVGVDISQQALNIASENAKNLGLSDRAHFISSDWTKNISEKFDIIISNPPYIRTDDINKLMPEVRKYDPLLSLDGGKKGLDCYREIIPQLPELLAPGGIVCFEIGQGMEKAVGNILRKNGFEVIKQEKDLAGIVRCLVSRVPAGAY